MPGFMRHRLASEAVVWRTVRDEVGVTLEINEKIDALYAENEELSQRLAKAEGFVKRK